MRILRAADHKVMPWKNGAGSTTEVAIAPAGTGLDGFDWRVSMAGVVEDGPFSPFPGIDRTLAVLEGEGIRLEVEGRTPQVVLPGGEPASFPGDAPTRATLLGGPIVDLNVMTRRGRYTHCLRCHSLSGRMMLAPEHGLMLVLALTPGLAVGSETLGRLDAVVSDAPVLVEAQTAAAFYLIELWESPGGLDK
ncbi:HutD family protein [Ancylobacter sp. VNQ12]|uniref:HutD/Ves family protein n=1 Tax=Ancylobacter sp. VNQ12 TaxID=3400920 RepID=UPI003C090F32